MTTTITAQVPRIFNLEVARGAVPGYRSVGNVGINPAVGKTPEDAWDVGGRFVFPTGAETWEILSDVANDSSAGTGARTVIISGLDTSYIEQTEIVSLNGTTPVTTTRTDWFRISSVVVISSGSNQANVGTITLRVSGGGLIRSQIRPDIGRTFNGFFTVPANKTLFVLRSAIFIPKNEDVSVTNKFLVDGTNTFINGGDINVYQNDVSINFAIFPTLPEKTDSITLLSSSNESVRVTVTTESIIANSTGNPAMTF